MKNIIVICILLAIVYFLVQKFKKQQNPVNRKQNTSLEKELTKMLGGDKQAALRLLRNARKNYPGRNYSWYYEKVIGDLERDRR